MALRALKEDVEYEEERVVGTRDFAREVRIKPRVHINTTLRDKIFRLVFVFICGMLAITFLNAHIGVRGYDVLKMRKDTVEIEQYNESLKADIAHLKSPKRVQDIAIHQLGMVFPKEVYFATSKK